MKSSADLRHLDTPGGLIPPAEMFAHPLPSPFLIDAHLPFGERVERAWKRLLAGFEEDEHERLREALVAKIEGERHGVTAAKEFPHETP